MNLQTVCLQDYKMKIHSMLHWLIFLVWDFVQPILIHSFSIVPITIWHVEPKLIPALILTSFIGDRGQIFKQYMVFNTLTKWFECTICQQSCSRKTSLVDHIESVHFPNSFVYSCQFCDQQLGSRVSVQNHLARVHKARKYYARTWWFFMKNYFL